MTNPEVSGGEALSTRQAFGLVLTSPSYTAGEKRPSDASTLDKKLVESYASPEDQGRVLGQALLGLPRDNEAWAQNGVMIYYGNAYDSTVLSMVECAGRNAERAASFIEEVERRPSDGNTPDWIGGNDPMLVFGRLVFNQDTVPGGVVPIAEHILPHITSEEMQKQIGIFVHSALNIRSFDPAAFTRNYDSRLVSTIDKLLVLRTVMTSEQQQIVLQAAIAPYWDKYVQNKQGQILSAARDAVGDIKDDTTYELANELIDQLSAFDPETARAFAVYANSRLLRESPDSAYALNAQAMIDDLVYKAGEIYATGGEPLPIQLQRALIADLGRKMPQESTIDGIYDKSASDLQRHLEQVRVIYNKCLQEYAWITNDSPLPEQFAPSEIMTSAVNAVSNELNRRRVLESYGFEAGVLPPNVMNIEVIYPNCELRYDMISAARDTGLTGPNKVIVDDVEIDESLKNIIDDIELFFLYGGKRETDTHITNIEAVGNATTAVLVEKAFPNAAEQIFTSLKRQILEWSRGDIQTPFLDSEGKGDGEPYKYSGSSFTNNAIGIRHEDGNYYLRINTGGYGYNASNPGDELERFAEGLNITDRLEYQGSPSVVFKLMPSKAELDALNRITISEYDELPYKPGSYIHWDRMQFDLAGLSAFYGRMAGINVPESLFRLSDDDAQKLSDSFNEKTERSYGRRHHTFIWLDDAGRQRKLDVSGITGGQSSSEPRAEIHDGGVVLLPYAMHYGPAWGDKDVTRRIRSQGISIRFSLDSLDTAERTAAIDRIHTLRPHLIRRSYDEIAPESWVSEGESGLKSSEVPS